jgi:1-acyl-sn-glycerol-3-phosphate acyltransferase
MPSDRPEPSPAHANRFFRLLRIIGRGLFSVLFRIEAEGLDRLPQEGGYALACNHLSWIDPLILMATLPPEPRIHYLAAAEFTVTGPRFVQWIVRHTGGIIPIDRQSHKGDRAAVVQALRVLRGGGVLGIFPEGRCGESEGTLLLPLKEGAASFAAKTGRPIQVVGMSGTYELYFRKRICIRVGPLLELCEGEDQTVLLERLGEAMAQNLPPLHPNQPRKKRMAWLSKLF